MSALVHGSRVARKRSVVPNPSQLQARGALCSNARRTTSRSGFTLAEVAVTIVIVALALVLVLQGLNTSRFNALHTRNQRVARELALGTLGLVESGMFKDEIESGLFGTYSEEGYPEFEYEVVAGSQSFSQSASDSSKKSGAFDSWEPRTQKAVDEEEEKDEEQVEEPFEKVKIRITYPKVQEFGNELMLERWIPWQQVYGKPDEESADSSKAGPTTSDGASSGNSSNANSSTGTKK